ncbi:MAG: ppnK [Chlamydiia bacterium]|nr:ppnK [Chlamydiia bacterium]
MIIALFPNLSKPQAMPLALDVCKFLTANGITVVVDDTEASQLKAAPLSSCTLSDIDFMISLGGDGSILRLVHRYPEIQAPIIGINLGSLGFLADIPITEVTPSLQQIISGNYKIQNRMVITGETNQGDTCFAVNEMVIHRGKNPSLIDLAVYVDGSFLNTFSADGIIIATPSGSTAYSLSAGGPILTPDLEACVITPICPHTTSCAPIVLMPKSEIQVQYLNQNLPVEIIYDGICSFTMKTGDTFCIRRSKEQFKLINLPVHDYFSTLRTKLNWSGTLKS